VPPSAVGPPVTEPDPVEPADPVESSEVPGVAVALGELLVPEPVALSWWKNAMPSAAMPPKATVVIVPSTAPAARAPRMREFISVPSFAS